MLTCSIYLSLYQYFSVSQVIDRKWFAFPELGPHKIFVNISPFDFPEKLTEAIATTSLVPGKTTEEKWNFIHDGLSRFAGRKLVVNDEVYKSASETNFRNRGIANVLHGYGRLGCDPETATDLYTRQRCLDINAHDLAVMGSTLADGGINPATGEWVVDNEVCHYTLAVDA